MPKSAERADATERKRKRRESMRPGLSDVSLREMGCDDTFLRHLCAAALDNQNGPSEQLAGKACRW